MLGRVVKRERPEKNPKHSITVNARDTLKPASNLYMYMCRVIE